MASENAIDSRRLVVQDEEEVVEEPTRPAPVWWESPKGKKESQQ